MEQLTEIRREFLQEMINISFGQAAASLAELLDVFVTLNAPKVDEIDQSQLLEFLEKQIGSDQEFIVTQQGFRGDFKGEILLFIGADLGKLATKVLTEGGRFAPELPKAELETEMVLEISNIVIGASLGQFSGLLKKTVRYEAPHILWDRTAACDISCCINQDRGKALIILTEFQIGDSTLSGFMFILLNQRWCDALYLAVDDFVEGLYQEENDQLSPVS